MSWAALLRRRARESVDILEGGGNKRRGALGFED